MNTKAQRQANCYIFYYQDLIDLYSGAIYGLKKTKHETLEMKTKRLEVLKLIEKQKQVLLEIESGSLNFAQELIIQNPPVYVARTKETKTHIEYFTAKTFWPLPDGERKEIKVYVGKADDYGGDTLNERAKQDAIKKMQETLRRRKNAGEI